MPDVCGECERWKLLFTGTRAEVGSCMIGPVSVQTWRDCTCPAFLRKADAADRAAKWIADQFETIRIGESRSLHAQRFADKIREEYAKDKEAR